MEASVLIQGVVSGFFLGLVFALICIGLSLIFGMMEIVNFAHGEFLMMGMYTSYWLNIMWKIDPLFSLPIAGTLMFLVGIVTHKLIIHRILGKSMLSQILTTFGLQILLVSVAQFFFTGDYRLITDKILDGRIKIGSVYISSAQVVTGIISAILCIFIYLLMSKTEIGKALQATAEDREAAGLVGIDSEKMFSLAWGISGACAGIAGAALSNIFYIYPTVGSAFSLTAFVAVALGGFGSVPGAIFGGIIIGLLQTLGGLIFPTAYKMVVVYSVYFIILMIKPQGLFGRY